MSKNFFDFNNLDNSEDFMLVTPEHSPGEFIEPEKPDEIIEDYSSAPLIDLSEDDFSQFTPVEGEEDEEFNPTIPSSGTGDATNKYQIIAQHIAETLGTELSEDDKFESEEDVNAFIKEKVIDKQVEEKWKEQVKNLSPERKLMFELKDYFDDDVTLKRFAQDLTNFNNLTDEELEKDEDAAKWILAKKYFSLNMSEPEVQEMIENDEALGKVTEKAKKFKGELVNFYNKVIDTKKAEKEAELKSSEEQAKKEFEEIVNSIESLNDVGGLSVNKRHKDAMKEALTKVVHTDENKKQYNSFGYKQLKHKKEIETALAFYDSLGLFNIDNKGNFKPDLSKLSKLTTITVKKGLDAIISDSQSSASMGGSGSTGGSLIDALEAAMKK